MEVWQLTLPSNFLESCSQQKAILEDLLTDIPVHFDFLFSDSHAEVISGKQEGKVFEMIFLNIPVPKFRDCGPGHLSFSGSQAISCWQKNFGKWWESLPKMKRMEQMSKAYSETAVRQPSVGSGKQCKRLAGSRIWSPRANKVLQILFIFLPLHRFQS